MDTPSDIVARIRIRLSQSDAHYGGDLIGAALVLRLFGDLATEIGIRSGGDEGLLSEYTGLRFTAPVHPGDFIEATARLKHRSRLRCLIEFEAHKVIAARYGDRPSAAEVLDPPVLVCGGEGTLVLPWSATAKSATRLARAGAAQ
ncbi:hotdog fold domain-containing protein [Streptomyces sp. NPDC001351]|uniref:hotdog fold domain-containing protein n=1 Tax=Streptomyces sp. NPDC001351 TaxID=3364564 RepID=UPI003692BDAD